MTAISERYAGVVLDLDGVVVRGREPLPGAAATVAALRDRGVGIVFATNNASRTAETVAEELTEAGIPATPQDVVTSAVAAAAMVEPGTRCLVIGMEGLRHALGERGCVEVRDPAEADAVVVGWDRSLVWDDLRRATLALTRGARFLATNTDPAIPSPEGLWPGNGAIVAALQAATGRAPDVAGKPHPPMFEAAAAVLPDGPKLMVGDRHETDITGAAALGWDTALVLSGVTPRESISRLNPRPTYVLGSVAELVHESGLGPGS
jgi:glycerol-1-phosphatase